MAGKPTEQLEYECATLLQEFGFTEYEAYTFVYLLRLGGGTAKDVADLDDVPRTRVYDAVESLHQAGMVDVKYSSPKRFTPVSRETALRKLDLQRENAIEDLGQLFDQLEPADQQPEEFGVWTVRGHEAVASRVTEFIDDAEDELVYMTVDELLSDDHLDALAAAEERGVDIYLAGMSEPVRTRIQERIPSTTVFETCGSGPKRAPDACSSQTSEPPSLASSPTRTRRTISTRRPSGGRASTTASSWCCEPSSPGDSRTPRSPPKPRNSPLRGCLPRTRSPLE